MATLKREDFLNAPAPKRETVSVPGLGGEVHVRQVTAGERDEFEVSISKLKPRERTRDIRARIVVFVAVDEEGRPLFTAEDVPLLSGLPASALEPIMNAHVRLNSMSAEDVDALAKN